MTVGAHSTGAFDGAAVERRGAPHVKFCGITRGEDAAEAARLGASAIGMVLWAGSARGVDVPRARDIVRALPAGVLRVGVFVNALPDVVRRTSAEVPLDVVQLHGDEPIEWLDFFTRPLLKAVTSSDRDAEPWLLVPADRVTLLVDAADPRRGGTGQIADWALARELSGARSIVLAGGLAPGNVARAIAEVRPYAVDVSSGVESAPGVKDHGKMRAFIEAVRATVTAGGV